ncbi:piggyBac transposable element-derived protein 3-like [Periplaneta americana]|uniref:piggyBac transposable element-derived protein 3-like n=1 Tax=Periplaneta americana TaxID=6978 RepID=UPI0037E9722B
MRGVVQTGKSLGTDSTEIKKLFGACIYTTLIGYPRLKMFWSARTRIPMIADNMSRNRFFELRTNLKVIDDNSVSEDDRKKDRFWKVRPMLDIVRQSCLQTPQPQNVSIDEQMIPFYGHVSMRQYVRGKPCPVGLKLFVMASASGLPLDFVMYQGKGTGFHSVVAPTPENFDIGGKAVLKLCDTLPAGSSIFINRYFTSVPLLDLLYLSSILASGTIMSSRIPKAVSFVNDAALKKAGRGT